MGALFTHGSHIMQTRKPSLQIMLFIVNKRSAYMHIYIEEGHIDRKLMITCTLYCKSKNTKAIGYQKVKSEASFTVTF